jgi:dCMP deaminase
MISEQSDSKKKWVDAYLDVAARFAMLSYANRLKVGAVLVKDHRIISIGYNGTPAGWDNTCEENNVTKPEVMHAEMNCILKLARSNESGHGAIMYITHAPCVSCASAIYGSGVKKVYYREVYRDIAGVEFLNKCGIPVEKVDPIDSIDPINA